MQVRGSGFFLARDLQLREHQKRERGLTLSGRKLPAVPWSIQCKSSKLLGPNGFLRYSSALICGIDRRDSPFSPTSYFFDYFFGSTCECNDLVSGDP